MKAVIVDGLALTLLALSNTAIAEIFRCEEDGRVEYSDSPCGDSSQKIEVKSQKVGGSLTQGMDTATDTTPANVDKEPSPPVERRNTAPPWANNRNEEENVCTHINSTKLRRLQVKEKVVQSMKPADVRKSWGDPSETNQASDYIQWVYRGNHRTRFVYLENGCVATWNNENQLNPDADLKAMDQHF